MRIGSRAILLATTLLLIMGTPGSATLIDFEIQGVSAPDTLNGTLNSPLVIGIAMFSGGELLNDETSGTDQTAVYATTNVYPGYTDPLTIKFSTPVSAFSVDITNEFGDTYTVSDNLLHSQTSSISANATALFMLPDSGITSVTIGSASLALWDFAIDNVQFTPLIVVTPEPSSLLLLAGAVAAIAKLARRKLV